MLPNIELSSEALIQLRINILEGQFRYVSKTIDYKNKLLLEHELGTAYLQLMLLPENKSIKQKHTTCLKEHFKQTPDFSYCVI